MTAAIPAGEMSAGAAAAPAREPWFAASLSLFFPGLGEWYAGAHVVGGAMLAAATLLIVSGLLFSFVPGWSGAIGMILLIGTVPLFLVSVWLAHRAARSRGDAAFDERRRSQHDAWKAVFLSRIVPGLGQLYDERRVTGSLILIATVLVAVVPSPGGEILLGAVSAAAAADAWWRARARRETDARTARRFTVAVVLTVLGGSLLIAGLKTFVVRAFRIPSESMAPTLEPGDRVLVNLLARNQARRGDIVLIPLPDRPGQLILKKAFALRGDVVEFRDDGAYRNGVREIVAPKPPQDASLRFRVPARSVFVLGDNYANSYDSRHFGSVALADVGGRAYKIYWPPSRARTFGHP